MPASNVVRAFDADQVSRLTGLARRQLDRWNTSGLLQPSYHGPAGGGRKLRLYSFNDVVVLRVLRVLQAEHGISPRDLRRVAQQLRAYADTPLARLTLGVCQDEVIVMEPSTRRVRNPTGSRHVLVPLIEQIGHVEHAANQLNRRDDVQLGRFEQHRNIAHNARVFAGTRVPVRAVQSFLLAGYSVSRILKEYPSLTRRDVEAVADERAIQQAA